MANRTKDPLNELAGRLAYYSRSDVGDPAKAAVLRRDLNAMRVEHFIRTLPGELPFTQKQVRAITAAARGGETR